MFLFNFGVLLIVLGSIGILSIFFATEELKWYHWSSIALMLTIWIMIYAERNIKKEEEHER